jgi:hypothetical protein
MVAVVVDLGDAAVGAEAKQEIVAAERDGTAAVAVCGDVGAELEESCLGQDDERRLVT